MIAKKAVNSVFIKIFLGLVFGLFILFFIGLNYVGIQEKKLNNRMYPNVYLDNKNIGRMTREEAYLPYKKLNDSLQKVRIGIMYKNNPVATLSGEVLNIHSDAKEVLDRAYLVGRTDKTSSRLYQKLATMFGFANFHFESHISYDLARVDELLDELEDKFDKPAKDALFQFADGRVVSFRQEEKGLKIKSKALQENLASEIKKYKTKTTIKDKKIVVEDEIVEPEVSLAEANEFGIEELIGEGISDFTGSIPGRVHNVTLSASRFNGVLVEKDKEISFNEIVGDISTHTGYQQAYVIKNGRTVLGDGGGVCQTSTTLFRAALDTGLPIIQRTAHAYRVSYYENDSKPGMDATVYAPSVDLKIKNNTPASILIQTEIVGNLLHFRFYGKHDGRKVEISPITVWDVVGAPEPKYEDDPTLKKGEVKQVDFAAGGAKAKFAYKVTGASPAVNFEKEFHSSYRPWQAVYLRGTAD